MAAVLFALFFFTVLTLRSALKTWTFHPTHTQLFTSDVFKDPLSTCEKFTLKHLQINQFPPALTIIRNMFEVMLLLSARAGGGNNFSSLPLSSPPLLSSSFAPLSAGYKLKLQVSLGSCVCCASARWFTCVHLCICRHICPVYQLTVLKRRACWHVWCFPPPQHQPPYSFSFLFGH